MLRILALGGLVAGLSVGVSGAATAQTKTVKVTLTGSAAGTIDDGGDVSATVNATGTSTLGIATSTVTLTGTIATGAGVGTSKAVIEVTPDSSGDFSGTFQSHGKAAITGTFSGSLTPPTGSTWAKVPIDLDVTFTVKYPPLGILAAVAIPAFMK